MKLTTKFFIFFTSFLIIWIAVMTIGLPRLILNSFDQLEQDRFEWEVERVQAGIEATVKTHELLLADWVKWDDAYDYVLNPNDTFIEVNIPDNLYEDQGLNFVAIYDHNMETAFIGGFDYEEGYSLNIPYGMEETFKNYANQSGLLYLDKKAYVFSSSQVTDSEDIEEPLGLMVFAFELTNEHIGDLADTLKEQLILEKFRVAYEEDKVSASLIPSDKYTEAVFVYPYLNVDYGIQLSLNMPHDITELGKESVYKILSVFIVVFLILSLVVYSLTRHTFMQLDHIVDDVSYIRDHKDLSKRITIKATGELGILKSGINNMLDEITHMHKQLTRYATLDPLTGILNRRAGFEKLKDLMTQATEHQYDLTISFVDLNNLKTVNDQFGHNAGDDYIKVVTEAIESNTRRTDVFCRLGGDEFLLIFPMCDEPHALETMYRIQGSIQKENLTYDYPMSICYGIQAYHTGMTLTQFVDAADQKMYAHKHAMKNNPSS